MKIKNIMAIMIAAVSVMTVATSCGDDEKETVATPSADAMVGTYKGDLSITVMGQASTSEANYVIAKVDDNNVSLTIPAAGSGAMAMPTLSIDKLPVEKASLDGVEICKSSLSEYSGSVTVDGVEKTYKFTDIAIVTKDNNISISYSLQYGKMPMAMVCKFVGKK